MLIIHIMLGIAVIVGMAITLITKNDKIIVPVRIGSILQLFSGLTLLFNTNPVRVCISAVMFLAIYLVFELLIKKTAFTTDSSDQLLE